MSGPANGSGNGSRNGLFRRGDLPILMLLAVQLVATAYGYGQLVQRVEHLETEVLQLEYRLSSAHPEK